MFSTIIIDKESHKNRNLTESEIIAVIENRTDVVSYTNTLNLVHVTVKNNLSNKAFMSIDEELLALAYDKLD